MKKTLVILLIVSMAALTGCRKTPRVYGNMTNWSNYDTSDGYVVYACGKDGCYSDGSWESNQLFDNWMDKNVPERIKTR